MVTHNPFGDVFDEFTARKIPYGFNHTAAEKGGSDDLVKMANAEEDGRYLGGRKVPITTPLLTGRIDRWNEYFNAKLRVIEGEMRDLHRRAHDARFSHNIMLIVAAVFSFIVFVAVLAVDYAVVSEFWSREYANEFGEVPEAFVGSIIIKALQVVVAALAFHFFFQSLDRRGRRIFTVVIFIISLLFLLSLGLLNASRSVPTDPGASIQDRALLEELGIEADQPAQTAPVDEDRSGALAWLESNRTLLWYAALGFLFVTVTAVAAMVLHIFMRAMGGLFGRMDNEYYYTNRSIMNRRDMLLRLKRAQRARQWLTSENARQHLLKGSLAAFETGYIFGLREGPGTSRFRFGGGGGEAGSTQGIEELEQQLHTVIPEAQAYIESQQGMLVAETEEEFYEDDRDEEKEDRIRERREERQIERERRRAAREAEMEDYAPPPRANGHDPDGTRPN